MADNRDTHKHTQNVATYDESWLKLTNSILLAGSSDSPVRFMMSAALRSLRTVWDGVVDEHMGVVCVRSVVCVCDLRLHGQLKQHRASKNAANPSLNAR